MIKKNTILKFKAAEKIKEYTFIIIDNKTGKIKKSNKDNLNLGMVARDVKKGEILKLNLNGNTKDIIIKSFKQGKVILKKVKPITNKKIEKGLEKAGYHMLGDKSRLTMTERLQIEKERQLQFDLSQIFSKKEKDIMKNILFQEETEMDKKLNHIEKLTKTDKEIWSRKIKKKLRTMNNLKDFSMMMLNRKIL